ncbi:MAG: hypothetical protein AABM64_08875 [Pseudomonadota bacterium]
MDTAILEINGMNRPTSMNGARGVCAQCLSDLLAAGVARVVTFSTVSHPSNTIDLSDARSGDISQFWP